MLKKTFEIANLLGLHVRASSKLVDLACCFVSEITIATNDASVDLKRILHVMSLGLKYKDSFSITTNGEDEAEAMQALENLICSGFGEN